MSIDNTKALETLNKLSRAIQNTISLIEGNGLTSMSDEETAQTMTIEGQKYDMVIGNYGIKILKPDA